MNKPFLHLNIPFQVKNSWKDLFPNLTEKQYVDVNPRDYLEVETIKFFDDLGLEPYIANIWSWLKLSPASWHIDQREEGEPVIAINFLLMGDAGKTEWTSFNKVKRIEAGEDPVYGTKDVRFLGSNVPEFSASIKPGYPMLIRNDIPHRVNRQGQEEVRWTIRLFIKKKDSDIHLSWDEAVEIFKDFEMVE